MPGREDQVETVSNLFSPQARMGAGHTVTTSMKTMGAQPVEAGRSSPFEIRFKSIAGA